jgi:MoxR-like ATPase
MDIMKIKNLIEKISENISKVIVGKIKEIDLLLIALMCGGHVLIEDNPGMGKTMLANTLAKSIDAKFTRIQFTPDLLPSDLTGINYYNQKMNEFIFRQGPLFSNIVLADEINRATPRTQSALLECMEEKQITIDNNTYKLDQPFMVVATQNPIETTGTFPLPEAQLDRFLIKLSIGYPETDESLSILERFKYKSPLDSICPVVAKEDIIGIQLSYNSVNVDKDILSYIVAICEETRRDRDILVGVSPRGSQALLKTAMAHAVISGRNFVIPDDVKYLCRNVLAHRMILKGIDTYKGGIFSILDNILGRVEVPTEKGI